MLSVLFVAVAGALGTLCRYGLNRLFAAPLGDFPWGTLLANCAGSFLFGVAFVIGERSVTLTPNLRLAILVGFCGAFTTFSTFAFEVGWLIEAGRYGRAAAHLLAHNVVGMTCLFGGLWLGRSIIG